MTLLTATNARAWLLERASLSLEDSLYSIMINAVIPSLPLADQGDPAVLSDAIQGITFYAHEFYPQPSSSSKLHDSVMSKLQPCMRAAEG